MNKIRGNTMNNQNSMSGTNLNPRKNTTSLQVFSNARNWPGISNLNKLLERDQDAEAPKLKILLFESLVAVYASLILNAFVFYDCSTLWRLLSKQWNEQMWNRLFGGGCQIEYKYKTPSNIITIGNLKNWKKVSFLSISIINLFFV